jgi:hypothetical protein
MINNVWMKTSVDVWFWIVMVGTWGTIQLALTDVQRFTTLLLLNGIILFETSLLLRFQQCQFGLFALLLHVPASYFIYTQPAGRITLRALKGGGKKREREKIKSLLVQNGARLFKQPNDKDTTLTVDGQHKICSTFHWYTTTFSVSSSFLTWFC